MSLLARIPLTVRHGIVIPGVEGVRELDAAGWDVLRNSDTTFGFGASEQQRTVIPRPRAERIGEIARDRGMNRLCSYGAGTGILERDLLELGFDLTITEVGPDTVRQLSEIFPSVVQHDLRDGPLAGFDLHVLHRVDCELSDSEWTRYFASVMEPHLMVMSLLLDWDLLKGQMSLRMTHRHELIEAGWFRTEARLRSLLPRDAQQLDVFDLTGFLVIPSLP